MKDESSRYVTYFWFWNYVDTYICYIKCYAVWLIFCTMHIPFDTKACHVMQFRYIKKPTNYRDKHYSRADADQTSSRYVKYFHLRNYINQCICAILYHVARLIFVSMLYYKRPFHATICYFDPSDSPLLLHNICKTIVRNKTRPDM